MQVNTQNALASVGRRPYALLSVWDKTGLEILGKTLTDAGFKLVATTSTARYLAEFNIESCAIESLTGVPEMLAGRVKTLHPAIFGGILWKRDSAADEADVTQHGLPNIDVVVCNLYPFAAHQHLTDHQALVEFIDVGGVSLLRAAAKNYRHCVVLSEPNDYSILTNVGSELATLDDTVRLKLACKAFQTTATYDATISNRLSSISNADLPETFVVTVTKQKKLRYGENPHQQAAVYATMPELDKVATLAKSEALQGKELSYNNLLDAQHALQLVSEWKQPAVAIVKHNTPCGVGLHATCILEAFQKAFVNDPVSPFGGIVCTNREVDANFAARLTETFLELVIAPQFTPEARERLSRKKNLRLLELNSLALRPNPWQLTSIQGGLLIQSSDLLLPTSSRVVTQQQHASQAVLNDVGFAMTVVKHVRSNAIALVQEQSTLAIAGGFTNRIDAVKNCLQKLDSLKLPKSLPIVMASDGFFPFADSVKVLKGTGVTHIVQPGGSQRDAEVIDACNDLGLVMYFTGTRHFKH